MFRKKSFFSFEWAKLNFTTVGPPWKTYFWLLEKSTAAFPLGKNPYDAHVRVVWRKTLGATFDLNRVKTE